MEVLVDYRAYESELAPLQLDRLAAFVMEQQDCPDKAEASLSFVSSEEIQELNNRYRHIDRPTDVLSFACDTEADDDFGDEESELFELGDVIIAPEVARAQCEEFATTFADELDLLVVHGMLHLLGYDHVRDEDALVMEARERELLSLWKTKNGGK